jgi:hypothetical protein
MFPAKALCRTGSPIFRREHAGGALAGASSRKRRATSRNPQALGPRRAARCCRHAEDGRSSLGTPRQPRYTNAGQSHGNFSVGLPPATTTISQDSPAYVRNRFAMLSRASVSSHSAGMVLTPPRFSRAERQAGVNKMRNVYKPPDCRRGCACNP